MTGFPVSPSAVTPLAITTQGLWGCGGDVRNIAGAVGPNNQTWVANLAVYCPFAIGFEYTVQRVWWINGSTITTTNVDCGIYTMDGVRLYSTGSTTQTGASATQFVTLGTPLTIGPGRYYMAWTCDNTTARAFAMAPTVAAARQAGLLQQATALPLPANATFAAMSNALMPVCGITRVL